jgi:hypothetical protein
MKKKWIVGFQNSEIKTTISELKRFSDGISKSLSTEEEKVQLFWKIAEETDLKSTSLQRGEEASKNKTAAVTCEHALTCLMGVPERE